MLAGLRVSLACGAGVSYLPQGFWRFVLFSYPRRNSVRSLINRWAEVTGSRLSFPSSPSVVQIPDKDLP
jgi:hypothetical protein